MIRHLIALGAVLAAAPLLAQEAATPASQVAAAVAADWPKYDKGGKGHLNEAEFATWLTALRAAAGKAEDPIKVKAWADGAFLQADADINQKITPEELTVFLQKKIRQPATAGR
jgi:hypothetical protein